MESQTIKSKYVMTVGELIIELQGYDPELEIKAENIEGKTFNLTLPVWQWDNSAPEPVLNTYLTISLEEQ